MDNRHQPCPSGDVLESTKTLTHTPCSIHSRRVLLGALSRRFSFYFFFTKVLKLNQVRVDSNCVFAESTCIPNPWDFILFSPWFENTPNGLQIYVGFSPAVSEHLWFSLHELISCLIEDWESWVHLNWDLCFPDCINFSIHFLTEFSFCWSVIL